MEPYLVIARNFPWSGQYDDASFCGRLHEEGIWSWDEYWLLEWALYQLHDEPHSRELHWPVFRIFSNSFSTLGAHRDSNDVFEIHNLNLAEFYDAKERMQLVFEGFFQGSMPDQAIFEQSNPLLISIRH
jgi:hypothetical protein